MPSPAMVSDSGDVPYKRRIVWSGRLTPVTDTNEPGLQWLGADGGKTTSEVSPGLGQVGWIWHTRDQKPEAQACHPPVKAWSHTAPEYSNVTGRKRLHKLSPTGDLP